MGSTPLEEHLDGQDPSNGGVFCMDCKLLQKFGNLIILCRMHLMMLGIVFVRT